MGSAFDIMALSGSFWGKFTDFFSPEFGAYDNFEFNETSFVAVKYIIIGIFFGIVIASLSALYNRRVLGKFIRALIKSDATSPEKAKTLAELGFDKNPFVKYSLSRGYTLKKSTSCVEYDEFLKKINSDMQESPNAEEITPSDQKSEGGEDGKTPKKSVRKALYNREFIPDLPTAHFYIPEEKKYEMDVKFEAKGTNWLTFAITVAVSFALVILAVLFLPDVLRLVDNFINGISGK